MEYTIIHRRTGAARSNLIGYRTEDIEYLINLVHKEIGSGEYTSAKIINAQTGKIVKKFNKKLCRIINAWRQ